MKYLMELENFTESKIYLKLYESENDSILIEFLELQSKYEDFKDKINNLVDDFLDYNRDKFEEKYDYSEQHTVEKVRRWKYSKTIDILFDNNNDTIIMLDTEDYNDLLLYLKDPEIYKETKKYNL